MLKKKQSPKIDEVLAQSVNFEVTIADLARKSERRAWMVATASVIVSLCLVGGYFYILPLKEKVPYFIMADAYTGTTSLARLSDDVINRQITSSEAVNRSNIARFIIARESYDLAISNMRDWPTVLTMSSSTVAQPYLDLHSQANPEAPFKVYGKNRAIRVKILSIVMIGGGQGQPPTGATVRFQRSVYDKVNGATYPLDSKIATMAFAYKPNLRMDDQNRLENPLGFQVTSYRVDNDYGNAAPGEVPTAAPEGALPSTAPATAAPGQPTVPGQPVTGLPQAGVAPVPLANGAQAQPYAQGGASPAMANGMPASTIPTEAGYPTQAPGAATPTPAAPAASPEPRSAANGGRRR
ncbi:type IV secretion system protein [Rothia nasimurium]|uniref:Conjugative transfer protein n=1 Tax=Luteibacter anthropi TaxID=564369 RepID=A0A7X5U9E2_9GAMM|nr:type IV secretion system protein [Luteibacter anthropi]NII06269.1 conjugative transfer protein [Luteibacter anthropi]